MSLSSATSAPTLGRRIDLVTVGVLVAVTLAIGLIDPNDQFLSANDIYIFRQIHHYFELFSWLPQDLSSPLAVVDKLARWVFWFFYYFHGAPPELYQAPLFGLLSDVGVSFRPVYGQTMVTGFLAVTVILFWAALRRASVVPMIAASAALLVACSPMLTGFSRGFGTIWLVNAAFSQALGLYGLLLLREGRGRWLTGLALTHIILSDPISFLLIGPLMVAWVLPARWLGSRRMIEEGVKRLRLLALPSIWALPLVAIAMVAIWNIVRARYAALIPGDQTLYVYPFSKYAMGVQALLSRPAGYPPTFGPHDWLRVAIISFGIWAPIGFPVILGAAAIIRRGRPADPLVFRWALISSLGFGLVFYVLAFPGMGSQEMPYIGYPVYTILPFITLLALQVDRLAGPIMARQKIAVAGLLVFAFTALLTTVSYIWQRPLVPGSSLLSFNVAGSDFIGIRRPYYGDLAAGAALRYAMMHSVENGQARSLRMLYVRKPDNVRFDVFWMYAGLEYGGRWFELRSGKLPQIDTLLLERARAPASSKWLLEKIEPVHRTIESTTELTLTDAGGCQAAACVVLDTTGKATDAELVDRLRQQPQLQVVRGDRAAYNIWVAGDVSVLPAKGVTDGRALEQRFRRDFPSLWDYIPPPDPLGFLSKFRSAISMK